MSDPEHDHDGLIALWVLCALVAVLGAVVVFGLAGTW